MHIEAQLDALLLQIRAGATVGVAEELDKALRESRRRQGRESALRCLHLRRMLAVVVGDLEMEVTCARGIYRLEKTPFSSETLAVALESAGYLRAATRAWGRTLELATPTFLRYRGYASAGASTIQTELATAYQFDSARAVVFVTSEMAGACQSAFARLSGITVRGASRELPRVEASAASLLSRRLSSLEVDGDLTSRGRESLRRAIYLAIRRHSGAVWNPDRKLLISPDNRCFCEAIVIAHSPAESDMDLARGLVAIGHAEQAVAILTVAHAKYPDDHEVAAFLSRLVTAE